MAISQAHIDRAIALAKEYGARRLILFGSALESLERAGDLDIACDGIAGWKLYEFGARLDDELRIPVDVIALTPPTRFTRYIERKGKVLYEA